MMGGQHKLLDLVCEIGDMTMFVYDTMMKSMYYIACQYTYTILYHGKPIHAQSYPNFKLINE